MELIIHFLTGGITIKASTSQYSHVMMGIALYHANGFRNQIASCKQKMRVASFHRLNRKRLPIRADIVGVKKVSGPIEVLVLKNETVHPKINPEITPQKIPRIGAVRAENKMLEKVICAEVPRTG
jgi:hypothetical protein